MEYKDKVVHNKSTAKPVTLSPSDYLAHLHELKVAIDACTSEVHGILHSLDLRDNNSLDVAKELLTRLAFLQATSQWITDRIGE